MPKTVDSWVALLRGINVGGKNMLPMPALVEMVAGVGCADVSTYIQSGNVVFRAPGPVAERVPTRVSEAIQRRLGLRVPVVVRSGPELAKLARSNPFLAAGADPDTLHVMFLADLPQKKQVAALDPGRSPPDEFAVRGKDIYLRCPNGVARTKLTNAWFDSRLSTVSTGRNWRTVLKLLELAGQGFRRRTSCPP